MPVGRESMKVTLFGAAFDPPHLGHLAIIVNLLTSGKTDAVWLVPVKEHPFGKQLAPENDRLAMTELLASAAREELLAASEDGEKIQAEHIRVETLELDEPGVSYTSRTLKMMATDYPEHQFSFVIGSDNLAQFHQWEEYEQMLTRFPFFVYPRSGYPFEPLYTNMIPLTEMAEVKISSSEVRQKVAAGESIVGQVPPLIEQYILKHRLYVHDQAGEQQEGDAQESRVK